MRRPGLVDTLLILTALASSALAAFRSRDLSLVPTALAQASPSGVSAPTPRATARRAAPIRSPFRLDGAIPDRRFGEPPAEASVQPVELPAVRYEIVVKALVGGPPWAAVLVGLPGESLERVVRIGDRFGSVQIERVGEDGVRLATGDTSWVVQLSERRP